VLAEIIASDVSLLVTFNQAIDGVIQNNQKARQNPKALAQLDGHKRPLVGSLSANLQRFGFERVAKLETLQAIIQQMSDQTDNEQEWTALFSLVCARQSYPAIGICRRYECPGASAERAIIIFIMVQ